MKTIVIGATGTIGRAVAELLKNRGHEVIKASRSSESQVDITDPSSFDRLYQNVREVDAVIATAGDAAFVPLDKLTEEQIQLSLKSKLMGQINMVRKGLLKLRPNGVFVLTGGILAYSPAPQTSMIAMVNLGLEGFVKAAALEMTEGRRISIVHPPWVAETAAAIGMDASPWPDAATVAEAYLHALESSKNGDAVFVKGYQPGK